MNKRRLAMVLDVIDEMMQTSHTWDIAVWTEELDSCKTKRCVIGYCMVRPEFIKEGLTGMYSPHYKGEASFWALREFFELPLVICQRLFSPCAYEALPDSSGDRILIDLQEMRDRIVSLIETDTLFIINKEVQL